MAVKRTVDTLCPNSKGSCKPTWEWPFGRNHFRLRGCLSKPTSDLSLHSSLTAELDYVWGARGQERGWEPSGPPCLQAPLGLGNMEESCFQHQRPIIKASIKSGKYFTPSILGRKEHNLYWVYWGERDVISLCKYTVKPGSQELNIHPWLLSSNIKDAWHTVSATCLTRYLISF